MLRTEGLNERTPIIALSSAGTPDVVVQAIHAGASFFLVKPVTEPYLLSILRGILHRFRNRSAEVSVS